ncbi:maleylpyruvate isomerase N-terminal domain-containing protein [Actinotalea sp. Marseille-Q4924]|uniref:maleylpyruvate isomerase N-terminal domain-containing protein n=1 Tax=Actinotalea sp. Marseille-Q4924 TaxID=2866571 RepID=UPI001CE3D4B5|nr:maleylpyruvate isomerase N-terminal domain-containing protein [Actinotalea sp. Marseille-Q4924]
MSGGPAGTGLTVTGAKELSLTAWDAFAVAVTSAGRTAPATATRLAGWSVEDLVRHTAWGMSMEAEALRLAVVGEAQRHGVRAAGRATDGLTGHPLDLAWHRSRAELAAAFDTVAAAVARGASPVLPMPYGDVPLPVALDTFVMEATVHADDLRAALTPDGAEPPLDPRAVAPCARFVQHFWPVLASLGTPVPHGTSIRLVGDAVVLGGTYDGTTWHPVDPLRRPGPDDAPHRSDGPSVTLRGDDSTVLRVVLGRVPVAASRLLVEGDTALGYALKEHVPGP